LLCFNRLTAGHLAYQVPLCTMQLRWDQPEDRAAEHLGFTISKDALGACVPAGDRAVQLLTNDGLF
jgi:hypothetical protein